MPSRLRGRANDCPSRGGGLGCIDDRRRESRWRVRVAERADRDDLAPPPSARASRPTLRRVCSMPSQKLVRCEIRRRGGAGPGSARFIPLEIFGLWEYLMSTKHEFTVDSPQASLWLDMEDSPAGAYAEGQYDRVTEVTIFVYYARDDMFTRVCRYFPSADCEAVKRILLSHYDGTEGKVRPQIRERTGMWIHREPATA